MKKSLLIAGAVASLSFASLAQAQDLNPWKHCGIGAMIFDDNPTAAAISNVIWDLGSTAVSSNISSQGSCHGKKAHMAAAKFIQTNHANLEQDMVMGQGQHLAGLADVLEVADKATFNSTVKQQFSQLMMSPKYQALSAQAKAEAMYHIAVSNA